MLVDFDRGLLAIIWVTVLVLSIVTAAIKLHLIRRTRNHMARIVYGGVGLAVLSFAFIIVLSFLGVFGDPWMLTARGSVVWVGTIALLFAILAQAISLLSRKL